MIGGVLSGLGFMLASQATTLTHLYLTMGLISGNYYFTFCSVIYVCFLCTEKYLLHNTINPLSLGSGWALVFTPTIASVMEYFSTRRALAMGLGFTGVGLSSFVFSPLFQYLVDFYGWRGALLILGGLSFNIVASGALIRPLRPTKVVEMVLIYIPIWRLSFCKCSSLQSWPCGRDFC